MPDVPEMKLELVPIPTTDVDRAKAFYVDKLGFHADHDVRPSEGVRVLQLTPPGSACSIVLTRGLDGMARQTPGAVQGLHLVVGDINSAREALVARGVEMDPVSDIGGIRYAGFSDPDGNTWTLQQIS